jgi:hypothetical protein
MPKIPVTARIAASRPITPSATVDARAREKHVSHCVGPALHRDGRIRLEAAQRAFERRRHLVLRPRERTTKVVWFCSLCGNGTCTTGCGDSCISWYSPFSATPTTSLKWPNIIDPQVFLDLEGAIQRTIRA